MEKKKISVCLLCFVYVLLTMIIIEMVFVLDESIANVLAYLAIAMLFLIPVAIIISIISLIKNRSKSDLIFVLLLFGSIAFFYWLVWPSYRGGPRRPPKCHRAYDCVCKSNEPGKLCDCKFYDEENNKILDIKCPYTESYKIEGES